MHSVSSMTLSAGGKSLNLIVIFKTSIHPRDSGKATRSVQGEGTNYISQSLFGGFLPGQRSTAHAQLMLFDSFPFLYTIVEAGS